MQDIDDLFISSEPRDQFAFMLLERLERLEDKLKHQEQELETLRASSQEDHKYTFLTNLIRIYQNFYSNNRDDPHYYMRALAESLSHWTTHNHKAYIPTAANDPNIAAFTQRVTSNWNTQYAYIVTGIVLAMNRTDEESFMLWDELPDLVDG
ncbi:hypothetical protein EBT25_13665 [bacterium]|nr:hypothetical protein [bacterium]